MERTKAQESRTAIERLYIVMRHLFNRGYYKPFGESGKAIIKSLRILSPEIYGSMNDAVKVELNGLSYIMDRLPKGIESCQFIHLCSDEGISKGGFEELIPAKRRRKCYRIDHEQMIIEVTRGRSEIYDILTHLTFFIIESKKIAENILDKKNEPISEWRKFEELLHENQELDAKQENVAITYLSSIIGCSFNETNRAHQRFNNKQTNSNLFQIIYWMAKLGMEELKGDGSRVIKFSPTLRERIGHHLHGELWAREIKNILLKNKLQERAIHIISSNLHSVMNSVFGMDYFNSKKTKISSVKDLSLFLSKEENRVEQSQIYEHALKSGMIEVKETFGTNIGVQLFDFDKIKFSSLASELAMESFDSAEKEKPVLLVMDYAFGEQAYELMDELLKPHKLENGTSVNLNVCSISIMGKAGILTGDKGDIMLPTAHVFEGTSDNYPFDNDLSLQDFEGSDLNVCEGTMLTVLGTSLQNKDVLSYFMNSSWGAVGLEMEGAHYQKAIQAATRIRKSVKKTVSLRYAYYASDNPLSTGHTLASGSLGDIGVWPTYLITIKILEKIFNS